jgi:transcription elongation factor Elf1
LVLSMFSQMVYRFTCPHCGHIETIVLSRLEGATEWLCEKCGKLADMRTEPYSSQIEQQRDTASEIDKWAQQRGEQVKRLD